MVAELPAEVAVLVPASGSTGAQVTVPVEAQMVAEVPTKVTVLAPVEAQGHW
jgi:hypothetical protein